MLDLWRGRLSYRRVWSLMQQLPQESRTQTILRDAPKTPEQLLAEQPAASGPPKFGPWAHHDYLLARLINAMEQNNYLTAVVGRLEPKPKPPVPVPVPGADRPVRKQSAANVAYLKNLRAKGA